MPNVSVGREARVRRAIVDAGAVLPEQFEVGIDLEADRARGYTVTDSGIVVVGGGHLAQ
jgi:glucose-1-phosphate adenylyltransferase